MRLKITLFLFINILFFGFVSAQCNADYEEVNGIAIIEAESKIAGSWSLRNLAGASGGQALYYAGSNQFNNPGTSAITYTLRVNNPGLYRVVLRSQIGVISTGPEPATSEHNDTWLRINGSEFFGQNGSSIVWPRGSGRTPVVAGSSGDGWLKAYTNQLGWTWNTFTNDGPGHSIYVRFTSAGTYNVQISGRSKDHIVDRIVLYQQSIYSTSQARDLSRAETTCGTPPPPPPPAENVAPTVNITSPTTGQSFDEGSNITVNLSASDSDGSIAKHEIFVNNSSVDIDNGNYTPYVFANAQPGTYNIRATVTDNDGATASSSVSITVNENTPPPPPENVAPTVSITYPANGQSFDAGSNFTVNLNSSDSDGSVQKHEIFVNGSLVSSQGSDYTPYQINNSQQGSYVIRATVTDNDGDTTSASVNVTINSVAPPPAENVAPSVSITSPSNGQSFDEGSTITVNLSASDSDGSIAKHEIFVNNSIVDTDDSDYTPHVLADAQAGTYNIRATVTDNDGATASSTVSITVNENTPPPPPPAQNNAPNLNITYPPNGQNFSEGSNFTVNLNSSDSDGTVEKHEVFVNGSLVSSQGSDYTPHLIVNPQQGEYVIEVTVTDNDGESTSSSVNVTIDGTVAENAPPILNITYPINGQSFDEGSNFTVNLNSRDIDGTVEKHEVFINGDLVSSQGSEYSPYLVVDPQAGSYVIGVTITDNQGKTATSAVTVTINEGDTPPPPIDDDETPTNTINLFLVNAEDNSRVSSLKSRSYINESLTMNSNVEAVAPQGTKSVRFELSGASVRNHTENFAPFALFGDLDGDFYSGKLQSGFYNLRVKAYNQPNGAGNILAEIAIGFTITNSGSGRMAVAFPNPVKADGRVTVRLPEGSQGDFQFVITNSQGTVVDKGVLNAEEATRNFDLHLSNVGRQVEGVYFLNLLGKDFKQSIPLIRK